jgi:hypothetical protein
MTSSIASDYEKVKTPTGKYVFLGFDHLKGILIIKHNEHNPQKERETVYTTNVEYNLRYKRYVAIVPHG